MKQKKTAARILTLTLSFAMLLQSGFVMPAFADGIAFSYSVDYNSSDKISSANDHYVIVPIDKVEAGPQESYTEAEGQDHHTPSTLPQRFEDPFRILGYTFNGWVTQGENGREVIFENTEGKTPTTIDDSYFPDPTTFNYLDLYGEWEEFGSPIITSGTVQFGEKNSDLEKLEDAPEWILTDTDTDTDTNIGTIDHFEAEKNSDNSYEYSTYVYNNVDYVNLTFEQYEPQAETKVYINDTEVSTTWTPVYPEQKYGAGYAAYHLATAVDEEGQQYTAFEKVNNVMVGKTIMTADMPLKSLSEGEDNVIRVEVLLHKDASALSPTVINNKRTYIFNVKRIQNELRVEYGNTPYGTMSAGNNMSSTFLTDWTYVARVYNKKAWKIFDDSTDNVVDKGSVPDASKHEYINYDLDKTAMVVYNGQKFVDRGISNTYGSAGPYGFVIIDKDGNPVTVDSNHTVTRTITVDTVVSLKYPWVTDETEKVVETKVLNGTAGENVVDILTKHKVKPGVYKIKYTYNDPDDKDPDGKSLRTMTATKNLIVIPRQNSTTPHHYDLNMDNYTNALDTLMYDVGVADGSSVSENLFRYRALDVYPDGTNDGTVDSSDKQRVMNNNNILEHYNQEYYKVAEDAYTMNSYTPSSADSGKAQLYMDFLGYISAERTENETTIPAHDDTAAVKAITSADDNTYLSSKTALSTDEGKYTSSTDFELWPGNTVFLGYRFDNISKLDTNDSFTDLKEITLSINYDARYMQPQAINARAVLNHITEYNPELADCYSITVNYDSVYTTDKSTASKTWNELDYLGQVRTLKLEMYLKEGKHYNFKEGRDNEYFIKLPFRVVNVPLNDQRCAISTQLSANTLNLALGSAEDISKYNGYMWDTSNDSYDEYSVTANLRSALQYMGDFIPNFVSIDKIQARELREATYGYSIAYPGFLQAAEVDESLLPPGLRYDQASGLISGTPTEARDEPFIFYLNGTKYSIKVNKAPLTVTADDKTKIYGDENPALTYTYTASDLRNGDYIYNGKPYAAGNTTQTLEKTAPVPVCSADTTTVVQSGYEIGFNEVGDFDNYELVYVSGSLDIEQRIITIVDSENSVYVPIISYNVFEGNGTPTEYTMPNRTTSKLNYTEETLQTFQATNVVNDDKLIITYLVTYLKPSTATNDPNVRNASTIITDIQITSDEYGRNYKFADEDDRKLTNVKGVVMTAQLLNIAPASQALRTNYTYGEPLDLESGLLHLHYDTGDAYVTYQNAKDIGAVELYYYTFANGTETLTKINDDIKIPVSYTGKMVVASMNKDLTLSDDDFNNTSKTVSSNTITVTPRALYVKADDKVRYYGQGYSDIFTEGTLKNDEVPHRAKGDGYTYTIVNGDDVAYSYGDKAYSYESSGTILADFSKLVYTCKDDPADDTETDIAYNNAYEIDKGKETTVRDIIVNTDAIRTSNPNYTILPYSENGTLTIRKRPLQITAITGGIPSLTAKYYTDNTTGLFVVPFNTAVEDEATGEVIRPSEAPALAVYDGASAETNTMTVRNSGDLNSVYSDDKVRVKYYAQYSTTPANLNDEAGQNSIDESNVTYPVTIINLEMDNTYEKSENYEVSDTSWTYPSITSQNGGRIYKRRIRDIEVLQPFKTVYTYGEDLDFSLSDEEDVPSAIKVTYDSDISETITFADALESYGFKVYYYRDGTPCVPGTATGPGIAGHPEWLQHADTGIQAVIKYEGTTLEGYQSNGWTYGETDEEKKILTVNKHRLRVKSDDVFVTYGNNIDQYGDRTLYTYTYNSDDLQHAEHEYNVRGITAATDPLTVIPGYSAPGIIVYEDDNVTEADIKTQAGTYPINISGAAADNYYFEGCYTNGTLTVRQRPLVVSSIDIPDLSQTDAFFSNLTKQLIIKAPDASSVPSVDGEGETVNAEFASGYELLSGDSIYISLDATYPETTSAGNVKVNISNAKIEELVGTSSRNYYLQSVRTPQDGTIIASKVASIDITAYNDPTNDTDKQRIDENTYQQKEYVYGDTIDLSAMRFTVQYDNGSPSMSLTYSQLADHGITVWFEDDNGASDRITDPNISLNIDYHNGKKIVFKASEALDSGVAPSAETAYALKVNKRTLHVTVSNLTGSYGETVTEDMVGFAYSGYAPGESMATLENDTDYVKPTLDCKVDGKDIFTNRIDVNVDSSDNVIPYEGVIQFEENTGESHNYVFEFDNTADFTVNKRELNVTDIIEGIPALSSEDLYNATHNPSLDENGNPEYDENGDPVYDPELEVIYSDRTAIAEKDSSGAYTTKQVEITEPSGSGDIQGLLSGDRVSFIYDVHYGTDPTRTITDAVEIERFRIKSMAEDSSSKNKNYYLHSYPNGSQGEIQEMLITGMKVLTDPDNMSYTYGELFTLSGGSVKITYNDKHTETVSFENLAASHVSLRFVDKSDNDADKGAVVDNTLLTVSDHNGAYIKLIPDPSYVETDDSGSKLVTAVYSNNAMTVSPHIMRVRTKDASMTYGDKPDYDWEGDDGWYYDPYDIVHGDSLTLASSRFMTDMTPPSGVHALRAADSVVAMDIDDTTPRGSYTITAYGAAEPGEKQNYYFVYVPATLTIDPKTITIASINCAAPALGADAVFMNGGKAPIAVTGGKAVYSPDNKDDITFSGNDKVINDDNIAISYSVEYNDSDLTPRKNVTVSVFDVAFDNTVEGNNNSNYVLTPNTPQTMTTGEIKEEQITNVEINFDPTLEDDNATSIQYTYGDTLDFDRGFVTVIYDSGLVLRNIPFNRLEDLTDNKIKILYSDGTPARHNDYLYPSKHNGLTIDLIVTSEKEVTGTLSTKPLKVQKATLTVTAHNMTRYYGDVNPVFTYEYSGFVYFKAQGELTGAYDTEDSVNFLEKYTPPIATTNAIVKSPIGGGDTYPIVLSGGASANYDFEFVNAQLTIERRPLDVEAITAGVPALTSQIIREQEGSEHKLSGTARNTLGQMRLGNFSDGDSIEITYTAVYENTTPASSVTVGIEDVRINSGFGEGNNYVLREIPTEATGTVLGRNITGIQTVIQPKLVYTYGETLDLSGGGVRISYDDGSYVIKAFDQLEEYGVELSYTDKQGSKIIAETGNRLTVPLHDGVRIHIVPPAELTSIPDSYTNPLVINKKTLRLNIPDKTSVYGDTIPKSLFEFEYGDDFVYEDTPEALIGDGEMILPKLVCNNSSGSPVDSTSTVGSYTINMTGGTAKNYQFAITPGTLRITKRPLVVRNITGGIPPLTADIIRANSGETHKLEATASNRQLDLAEGSLVNDDAVRIKYRAVYNKEEQDTKYNVGIEYISMDDVYGRSYNYSISGESTKTVIGGGHIYDKEITAITLTKQPKLEYTYGEPLDLSEGEVHIEYDTGFEEDITLDKAYDYRITLTYAEDVNAHDGDRINVPFHSGRKITLTATTPHEVAAVETDALTVNKKTLNINVREASSIYGEDPSGLYAFDYGDDFAYEETAEALVEAEALTPPELVCFENDGETPASGTTPAGSYAINAQGASADNYTMQYNNSSLTIDRRALKITDITGGIPPLTSTAVSENPEGPYKVGGLASNRQLKYENLVNDDNIRIKYLAVYNEEGAEDVDIEYVSMDDGYGRSANYTIDPDSIKTISGGGNVIDKGITDIEIVTMPRLDYIYGDPIDISEGVIRVTYDTGVVEEITLDKAEAYGVILNYDDEADTPVVNGDTALISFHNGRKMVLSASGVHEVTPAVTDEITVGKRMLEYAGANVDAIEFDGETTTTTGHVNFANPQNGDEITTTADFTFRDASAGEDKIVDVTNITLNSPYSDNYLLPSTSITATGTITKTTLTVPPLTTGNISISDTTNNITVNAPELTETQIRDGAKYEYSIDGGETWQESNVFENIDLGQDCQICVRFAETDNYNVSEAAEPVSFKAYKVRISLISRDEPAEGEDYRVLRNFYTNTESVEKEDELRELIGEITELNDKGETVTVNYYTLTSDLEGKETLEYPLTLEGDMTIYATLKSPRRNGGGGGNGGVKAEPTATPEPSASPEPTESPSPSASPEPAATSNPDPSGRRKNIPYLHGFEGMIKPDDYMTRAEAATIMVMLSGDTGEEYENIFPDVREDTWYVGYISQAAARGLISGFDDGNFYPEDVVTREQFAAMVVRMIDLEPIPGQTFEDVAADRWSAGSINAAVEKGIVTGYADGTFRPEEPTRRSEAVRMINVATERIPDKAVIDTLTCPYTDLPNDHWAYYEFMIASVEFDIP